MRYSKFVDLYEEISSTTKRLEKTEMLSVFLADLKDTKRAELIYLLQGRVVPEYDGREFGISTQLVMKALHSALGVSEEEVQKVYNKTGDLGEMAAHFVEKRSQSRLFSKEHLTAEKVFDTLKTIFEISGKGAVDKKMSVISELFSLSNPKEAKYIVRTLLNDLRIGVADSTILDAIALTFFKGDEEAKLLIEEKLDLANDISLVFDAASKGKKELHKISLTPGRPVKVMLPVKVETIEEAFEICGKPAAFEHKYDGFRMLINKKGNEVVLFTRKLENVTNQFPDVVKAIKEHVKGESFVLDSEVVGYDAKTKKYQPFEAISQRIRRKYDIEDLINKLPVEINVFDIIYHDGEQVMDLPFFERRKLLDKVIKEKEFCIKKSAQFVTDSEKVAEEFYRNALKQGEEGIMIKKLDAPYKQGRRVGYMAKLKPVAQDLDLVIVGAEHGTGKRAGWLTSFIVACKEKNGFVEVGKVSSGLKEKEEEGTTYEEVTRLLKPLITESKGNRVTVKPKLVVSVIYQNLQHSPEYSSGFALRFPRITAYRPDRQTGDIATLEDIKKLVKKQKISGFGIQ